MKILWRDRLSHKMVCVRDRAQLKRRELAGQSRQNGRCSFFTREPLGIVEGCRGIS